MICAGDGENEPERVFNKWFFGAIFSAGLIALAQHLAEWGVDEMRTRLGRKREEDKPCKDSSK